MLTATDLVRRFGDRLAVDSIGFEVHPGEVFGLLGPNGAGKTTVLRMLGGLLMPTSGRVVLDGIEMTRASSHGLRARIGFLTETPGLWEQLTVADNLEVYGRLFGMPDAAAAANQALERFELWDRRHDRAGALSKGMKQKLALARALLHDPEVVLLDEPTANLDPQTARSVRDLLGDLRRRGRTVVVSTHNLDEIERVADRVALIRTTLVAVGEPSLLRRQIFGRRLRIRLGPGGPDVAALELHAAGAGARDIQVEGDTMSMAVDDPDATTPAIVRALVEAGAAVREVSVETPPLEEVYVRLLAGKPA